MRGASRRSPRPHVLCGLPHAALCHLAQLSTFALTLFRHVGVVDGAEYKARRPSTGSPATAVPGLRLPLPLPASPSARHSASAEAWRSPADRSAAGWQIDFWDTAGQERFNSMHPAYYHMAHACIMCFDVTRKQTYKNLPAWYKELRDYRAGIPVRHDRPCTAARQDGPFSSKPPHLFPAGRRP